MRTIIIAASLAIAWHTTFSEERTTIPKSVQAIRTTEAITIDGMLSESVWQIPAVTMLLQREPDQGKQATERSKIYLAYDNDALYVGAQLYDSAPDSICNTACSPRCDYQLR